MLHLALPAKNPKYVLTIWFFGMLFEKRIENQDKWKTLFFKSIKGFKDYVPKDLIK